MSFCDRYPLLLTPDAIIILPRIHEEPVCPIVLGDTIQGPLLVAILCFIHGKSSISIAKLIKNNPRRN